MHIHAYKNNSLSVHSISFNLYFLNIGFLYNLEGNNFMFYYILSIYVVFSVCVTCEITLSQYNSYCTLVFKCKHPCWPKLLMSARTLMPQLQIILQSSEVWAKHDMLSTVANVSVCTINSSSVSTAYSHPLLAYVNLSELDEHIAKADCMYANCWA